MFFLESTSDNYSPLVADCVGIIDTTYKSGQSLCTSDSSEKDSWSTTQNSIVYTRNQILFFL